ncbi:dihydrofolate reductase family protein [Streptomyces sp. NPDC005303]|uniref:dihydrofolate reductase family protein n=1 Tax=Streptomyces sp. NPDC005303 TaxID=3155713 RepID=UPI0033B54210
MAAWAGSNEGKDVGREDRPCPQVFSPTIGGQLLKRGLIDEIDLHMVPVLLGDGIRLFDNPGGGPSGSNCSAVTNRSPR